MKSKSINSFKQGGLQTWVFRFAIVLGLPFLLYVGYCWGLWGRHSLFLQYLFQCNCPSVSQEARYPRSVDVIVPACRYGSSILSPSGRLIAVYEKKTANASPYLMDLQTGERILLSLPEKSGVSFLTDNLLYVSLSYDEIYVLDRTTGNQYPIREFRVLGPGMYIEGHADPNLLVDALERAKYVFFRDQDDSIVALDPDFPASAENNFMINRFGIPGDHSNRTEDFLKENNILYETILPYLPEEVISPDRRFVARPDGIYLVKTGQKIVEAYSASRTFRAYSRKYFFARGWTYDGKGVIYSKLLNPCLIETSFIIFDDPSCFFEVPQPLIKLKVPEEYLLPNGIQ